METADLMLDGNAIGGLLREVFVEETTTAKSTCASCGAVREVGALHVFAAAPGMVVRCPGCGAVMGRIVAARRGSGSTSTASAASSCTFPTHKEGWRPRMAAGRCSPRGRASVAVAHSLRTLPASLPRTEHRRRRATPRSLLAARPSASSDFAACICEQSRSAASSRSRIRLRCAWSRASPSSSARTDPGKSNIADAIVWAAGSLSPSELRAEKPDDVLYAGSKERPAADWCEVELLFDNESGDGPLDVAELSVVRRTHRDGDGEYLVNRARVRRTDIVELLADIGLAGERHSIISQGRVEEILVSKPEERRALVEEAAGLGKFKRRRHRAELKLARVQVQAERARDLEDEVRKRLRPWPCRRARPSARRSSASISST